MTCTQGRKQGSQGGWDTPCSQNEGERGHDEIELLPSLNDLMLCLQRKGAGGCDGTGLHPLGDGG